MHSSISLSELLTTAQYVLRDSFPDTIWVRAEVSSLSARPNSHCYMEFAEKGADDQQFAAKVRANCWRNDWMRIAPFFEAVTGMPLAVGMQVLAEVSLDLHPVFGLSLIVHGIDPTFTLGDLARQKEEALRRLTEEGVVDMQKALTLATLPLRVAVISSASAAGYQDFVHQLTHNVYGFPFQVTLYEAIMQGDSAAESIISALNEIFRDVSSYSAAEPLEHPSNSLSSSLYDVVVLIRGGGASTDLSCFDRYELAAHCAQFPLPIIAGIGHTRDVSLVDHVAFLSVKTPTAAAEYLISLLTDQLTLLDSLSQRLLRTADMQVTIRRTTIDRLQSRLQMAFNTRIQKHKYDLDLIEKTITLHSPERIFRKGYSLTTHNGQVVRDASQLKKGDQIRTELASGAIESQVI